MTREQIEVLEGSVDRVVELEMRDGGRVLGKTLFVYTGEENPDVFLLPVERGADGEMAVGAAGRSILLDEIVGVRVL